METKDHLYLAKLISKTADFQNPSNKKAFEYGSIDPDINLFTYIKGHTYSGTASYVKNVISSLHGKLNSPADHFNLGRAVHFIADYFTFPHTKQFKGNIAEHVKYEKQLHKLIKSQDEESFKDCKLELSSPDKCISLLDKALLKYSHTKESMLKDWSYIRFICSGIVLSAAKRTVKAPMLITLENAL